MADDDDDDTPDPCPFVGPIRKRREIRSGSTKEWGGIEEGRGEWQMPLLWPIPLPLLQSLPRNLLFRH